jgi:hypothetical protein
MGRKTTIAWVRAVVLAGAWIAAAATVQSAAGSELGGSVQRLGERLELDLRTKGDKPAPPRPASPPRNRPPEETFQPWEHVAT